MTTNMFYMWLNASQIKTLKVETLGYVGIGFSPTGGMHGADIILAWVEPDSGAVILSVSP